MHRGGFLNAHRRIRRQELLLTINKIAGVVGGQLKAVAVRDGVSGAGLNAVAAEDAAVVINVVDLGVALSAADAVLRRVLSGLNVNAVRRTRGGAEEAGHALFQSILIALEHVQSAESLLEDGAFHRALAIGIVFDHRRSKHLPK